MEMIRIQKLLIKLFENLKLWKEEEYLEIYANAKRILKNRLGNNRRYLRKTYKQKYNELLFRHINLKQNYFQIKSELEKIS